VDVEGVGNTLRYVTIRDTEGVFLCNCFTDGDETRPGNVLLHSRIEATRGDAIVVEGTQGTGSTIARYVVVRSSGDGIIIKSSNTTTSVT
jgi:hypothetical protein